MDNNIERASLKDIVEAKNLKLRDLEIKADIDISALSRIIRVKEAPSTAQRRKLAHALEKGIKDINFPICILEDDLPSM